MNSLDEHLNTTTVAVLTALLIILLYLFIQHNHARYDLLEKIGIPMVHGNMCSRSRFSHASYSQTSMDITSNFIVDHF